MRVTRVFLAAGLLVTGLLSIAAPRVRISAEQLLTLLAERHTVDTGDREIADELKGVELTTRLPADAIPILSKQDFGSMTMGRLKALVAQSADLPAPKEAIITEDAPPDEATRKDMLDRMTSFASAYVNGLPRFMCLETTRYFSSGLLVKPSKAKSRNRKGPDAWNLIQKITEEVRYHDGAEEYRTKFIDDQPSTMALADVQGSFSRGEFGTILNETFDPKSQARFDWNHWETVQGKRMAVWSVRVSREHSRYIVCCISLGTVTVGGVRRPQRKSWAAAYSGLLYSDPETGAIRRFAFRNVDIPEGYNLDDGRTLLDFEKVTLNARQVWLPRHALHYTRQAFYRNKNEIEFTDFHSFEADSVIAFPKDDASPKP
jgi:hypothetical protein